MLHSTSVRQPPRPGELRGGRAATPPRPGDLRGRPGPGPSQCRKGRCEPGRRATSARPWGRGAI